MPRLHIFRPGAHTDMRGERIEFTAADLERAAAAYDPELSEAPLVVGHPDTNAPAYGWVRSLAFANTLQAEPHQVDPAFAEMVNAGRFKKISASFYKPDAPSNPKPGVWYLRHVGFLGAAAPAVKGLKAAAFTAPAEDVVDFTGGEVAGVAASTFRRLREWLIAKFGLEAADQVVPDWSIGGLESIARSEREEMEAATAGPIPATSYREPAAHMPAPTTGVAMQRSVQELEAELAEEQARTAAAQQAAAAAAQEVARIGAAAFAAERVREGRLLPVHVAGVVAFIAALPADQEVSFAAEGKETREPLRAWFERFLREQPVAFSLGEHAKAGEPGQPSAAQFAAPPGYAVSPESADVHAQALAYQAAHADVDYIAAVKAVSKGA